MRPNGKIAVCFPGQLQERPLLEDRHPLGRDPSFMALLDRVETQKEFDPSSYFSRGEEKEEDLPLKLQMATYLLSFFHFHRLLERGWIPDILAEHSMGIYGALAASGAITFEEGLFITRSIGKLLQEEGALCPGAMASVIGLSLEEVHKILNDLDGYHLVIANYNGSMHYVISGEAEGVQKAIGLALSRKAIAANRLSFNTALHSPSLSHLRGKIMDLLREIEIRPLGYPILNHWTVRPLKRGEVKDFLSEEIARPVYWVRCVEKLVQEGVRQFVEVGGEATLSKLIRWINREVEAFSAEECLSSGG